LGYIIEGERMAVSFKGAHYPKAIILRGVRWYVAYPLSTPHSEELMEVHGMHVDYSTINWWTITYSLLLKEAFHLRKRLVWVSSRMDETTSTGIELMHMIKKRQLRGSLEHIVLNKTEKIYILAAQSSPSTGSTFLTTSTHVHTKFCDTPQKSKDIST
jgi:hypothetical protein